jgi:hypothetical protein
MAIQAEQDPTQRLALATTYTIRKREIASF